MSNFGHILSAERKSRGISQHRLANDVETTQRHLSFLETGRSKPSREMIIRLAEALQMSLSQRSDCLNPRLHISLQVPIHGQPIHSTNHPNSGKLRAEQLAVPRAYHGPGNEHSQLQPKRKNLVHAARP